MLSYSRTSEQIRKANPVLYVLIRISTGKSIRSDEKMLEINDLVVIKFAMKIKRRRKK